MKPNKNVAYTLRVVREKVDVARRVFLATIDPEERDTDDAQQVDKALGLASKLIDTYVDRYTHGDGL